MRGRVQNPLLRFRLPAVLLAIVIAVGVSGYVLIEHWSPFDAFFMTIITISTVGYGEVHPQSVAGRAFSSVLIVVGVGTMLFGFGVFAETLAENAFGMFRRQRQMEHRLHELRDHFIVCGYGRIGTEVVVEFDDHKVPYVIIDSHRRSPRPLHKEERLYIEGDAASEDILHRAGIDRARGLISAVDSDERRVYVVLAAQALNPKLYIIAAPDTRNRSAASSSRAPTASYRRTAWPGT